MHLTILSSPQDAAAPLLRAALLILLVSSLAACASLRGRNWPDEIPPREVFVGTYLQDERNQSLQPRDAYLGWIVSFYQGTVVYPRGWLDIEDQLLERIDAEQRETLETKMEELGIAIGAEWAKLNEERVIDNRMLALWGSIMQLAQVDRKELDAVELIASDVERLYDGQLRKQDVVESRYTDRLGLESFGDF
jgi:predicted small lipoprotein YifL